MNSKYVFICTNLILLAMLAPKQSIAAGATSFGDLKCANALVKTSEKAFSPKENEIAPLTQVRAPILDLITLSNHTLSNIHGDSATIANDGTVTLVLNNTTTVGKFLPSNLMPGIYLIDTTTPSPFESISIYAEILTDAEGSSPEAIAEFGKPVRTIFQIITPGKQFNVGE